MLLKYKVYDNLLLEFFSGVGQDWKETPKWFGIIYKLHRMNEQSLD